MCDEIFKEHKSLWSFLLLPILELTEQPKSSPLRALSCITKKILLTGKEGSGLQDSCYNITHLKLLVSPLIDVCLKPDSVGILDDLLNVLWVLGRDDSPEVLAIDFSFVFESSRGNEHRGTVRLLHELESDAQSELGKLRHVAIIYFAHC